MTGSLWGVKGVTQAPARDGEWFRYDVIVRGRTITPQVNGRTVNEFEVKDDCQPAKDRPWRVLGHGTFALQRLGKGSRVMFRNIPVGAQD
jgi:hypothetical protein